MNVGEQQNAADRSLPNFAKYSVDAVCGQIVRDTFPDKTCRLGVIKTGLTENIDYGLLVEVDTDESSLCRYRSDCLLQRHLLASDVSGWSNSKVVTRCAEGRR